MSILKRKILPRIFKAKKKLGSVFDRIKKKPLSFYKGEHSGADLDKRLVYSLSKSKIPTLKQVKHAKKVLSFKELWVIRLLFLFVIINLGVLGVNFYHNNLKRVPAVGGEYIEGVVGVPRYINPLYSQTNDIDKDIGSLIFSSLYKNNKDGELVPDLVTDFEVNEDNTIHTFTIRDDVNWHNGERLTAEDVVFTFNTIKNSDFNSPLRSSFSGVEVKQIDEYKVEFTLSSPYAPFKQLLTFGILPKHAWGQIPAQSANLTELNLKPIGSGPYQFQSLVKDKAGNIMAYNLARNGDYYGDKPYIEKLQFNFYVNYIEAMDALNRNKIDGIAHLPYEQKEELAAQDSLNFHGLHMSRVSSVFLNQNSDSILENEKLRQALAYAIDRQKIVNSLPSGSADIMDTPFPTLDAASSTQVERYGFNEQEARNLLEEEEWEEFEITEEEIREISEKKSDLEEQPNDSEDEEDESEESSQTELTEQEKAKLALGAGQWLRKQNEDPNQYLSLELTTVDSEKNREMVNGIKEAWEGIGIHVDINTVPPNQIYSQVIEPKNFEAFYYTQAIDEESDYYAFWHSSQAERGGLNISNYKNEEVDELLKEARTLSSEKERVQRYKQAQELIVRDLPALFISSPRYLYVQDGRAKGFDVSYIKSPEDRFSNITDWYIKTREKLIW